MISNRVWQLGAAIVCIGIIALGWFLGVSPKLTEMSAAEAETESVDQQNLATEADIAQLKAEFENLDEVAAELDALRASLPASADYARFLAELNTIAGDNSASLSGFTPTTPVVLSDDGTPADPAAADAGAEEGATDAAPEATTLADGTLVAIPTTLSAVGSFRDLLDFVKDLQYGERLFLVSGLSFTDDAASNDYSVAVTGYIYVEIDSSVVEPSDAIDEEAPVAPDATETPQPTETPEATESPEPVDTPAPASTP
jgi:Tfp pilus assembly protein PilO